MVSLCDNGNLAALLERTDLRINSAYRELVKEIIET
jgi:hypothetical protein